MRVIVVLVLMLAFAFCSGQEFDMSFGEGGVLSIPQEKECFATKFQLDSDGNIYVTFKDLKWDAFSRGSSYRITKVQKYDKNGKRIKKFGKRGKIEESYYKWRRTAGHEVHASLISGQLFIFVWDKPEWGIKVYSLDGKLKKHFKFEVEGYNRPIEMFSDKLLVDADDGVYAIDFDGLATSIIRVIQYE